MTEDNKPKVTLIKKSKMPEVTPTIKADVSTEKKKIVIVKKKPTVVVKAQNVEPSHAEEKSPVIQSADEHVFAETVKTEIKTEAPMTETASVTIETKATEQTPASESAQLKPAQPNSAQSKPVQGKVTQGQSFAGQKIIGAQFAKKPVTVQKKVVKKSSATQSTINMGPVIISGDNLPPILPKNATKPYESGRTSDSVGSVGGVNYGRDGQRLNNNGHKPGNFTNRQGGQKPQAYVPRSAQQANNRGNFGNRQGGFNKDGQRPSFGQKPAFGSKDNNRGGFRGGFGAPSEPVSVDKNRRVYTKDKGMTAEMKELMKRWSSSSLVRSPRVRNLLLLFQNQLIFFLLLQLVILLER